MAGELSSQHLALRDAGAGVGWQPLLLDPSREWDQERIAALTQDSRIQIVNQLVGQARELHKLRPPVDEALLQEPHRWVYYPWRRALVAILGPQAFSTLRLDRNRNHITRQEQAQRRRQRIGVVGLSVGHTIAY